MSSCRVELERLSVVATQQRWPDVEFLCSYARFAAAADAVQDCAPHARRILDAARRSGDDVLLAAALAARATLHAGADDAPDLAAGSRDLARAVALLDAAAPVSVHGPLAYMECAIAYYYRDLWELSVEMNDRALALSRSSPAFADPTLARIARLDERAAAKNVMETVVPLACSLAEVGDREQARRLVLAHVAGGSEPDRGGNDADLPELWRDENRAVRCLLAALAQEPETDDPHDLLARLDPVRRLEYRTMVWLACAVRAVDAGDGPAGAVAAEIAVQHDDSSQPMGMRTLAMSVAAAGEPEVSAAHRYARELVRMRWRSRLAMVDAARTALESERLMLETRRLSERAYLDELTGLGNRHAYARYLERLRTDITRGLPTQSLVVLMVDIDHFKEVNDSFGHAVGDEVLRRMGGLLSATMRVSDFGVRLGGDEFLLLLVGGGPLDVDERSRHLVESVRFHPWHEVAPSLAVTVSVGVAVGRADGIDGLLNAADSGLYRAKAAGRNQAVRLVDLDAVERPWPLRTVRDETRHSDPHR